MPTIVNSYRNSGDSSIGDSLASIGNTMFGPGALQAQLFREKAKGAEIDNAVRLGLGARARAGALDFNDPETRALVYQHAQPKEIFEATRGVTANTKGALDPATTNAVVGAGGAFASTGEGYVMGQNNELKKTQMQVDKAAQTERWKADNTPTNIIDPNTPSGYRTVSRSEALQTGAPQVLSNGDAEGMLKVRGFNSGYSAYNPQQQKAAGALVPQDHMFNWDVIQPDGTILRGRTADGKTDMTTGQALPPTARLVSPGNAGGAMGPLAPDSTQQREIRGKVLANQQFSQLIDRADKLVANDPSIVGAPGVAQRLGQNAISAARDVANFLGQGKTLDESLNNIRGEAVQKLGASAANVLPELFKPDISELEALHSIMVYKGAEAMLGQSGRDLSDRDVAGARTMLGDPNSMFESSQAFRTKMGVLKNLADRNVASYTAILNGQNINAQPQAAPQPLPQPVPITPAAPVAQPAGQAPADPLGIR